MKPLWIILTRNLPIRKKSWITSALSETCSPAVKIRFNSRQHFGRKVSFWKNRFRHSSCRTHGLLWISMVDHVVVHSKEDIRVVYRDGIEKNTGFLSYNIDV